MVYRDMCIALSLLLVISKLDMKQLDLELELDRMLNVL